MTSESMINYEALAQEAMRGVVRSVLIEAAEKGLPGDHHFYISFDTLAPGVILSKRLREKYAEEMTIVLQHRFWDLIVTDKRFEVKLTFDGVPERLVVPFKAIRVFFDPSVRYGLQFEAPTSLMQQNGPENGNLGGPLADMDTDALDETFDDPFAARDFSNEQRPTERPLAFGRTQDRSLQQLTPSRTRPAPAEKTADGSAPAKVLAPGAGEKHGAEAETENARERTAEQDADESAGDTGGAQIVSLDAFRKK